MCFPASHAALERGHGIIGGLNRKMVCMQVGAVLVRASCRRVPCNLTL